MKRFFQISITFIILISLFIPSGLEFAGREIGGVEEAEAATNTFAVISDYGICSTGEQSVATMVAGWSPSYIVTAGDNWQGYNMDGGGSCDTYAEAVGTYYGSYVTGNTLMPSPGNHDYYADNPDGLNHYKAYFDYIPADADPTIYDASRRYYNFTQGDVEFFLLDTPGMINMSTEVISDTALYDAQYAWLQTELGNSLAKWQIVLFHFPPYSSSTSHYSMEPMRWPFASWGADAVFSGHNHVYERVMQDGIPYFTVGLGGQTINSFGTVVDGSTVRYNSNYGAMKITTTDKDLTFQFLSLGNTVQDTYVVAAPAPTISVDPNSLTFVSPVGITPAEQSYSVTGMSLTAGITVTAPTDFQLSLTSGSGFGPSISLPAAGGTVYVQSLRTTEGTSSGNITHASTGATTVNLAVSASVGTADITTSVSSLPAFPDTVLGVPSAAQSYTVSGAYLQNNLVVTAPAGFEVSLSQTSGFGGSLTLTPVNYTIPATPIFVRFKPTEAISYSGNVSNVSNPTENVGVSGNGIDGTASIQKAVDKTSAEPGEVLTYTLSSIGYLGSDLLSNVTVTDTIPSGTTYVADSDTPEATEGTGVLTWNLGSNSAGVQGEAGGSAGLIELDSTVSSGVLNDGTTLTFSHTTGSSTNRLMLVGISWGRASYSISTRTINSVTFSGTALTPIGTRNYDQYRGVAIYSLLNPPASTTANVVVTFNYNDVNAVAGAATFRGFDVSTPLGTFNSDTGASGNASVNVTSQAGDLVFDTVVAEEETITVGTTDQTQRWNTTTTGSYYDKRGGGSTELATGTTTTMSWTISTNSGWAIGAVPIKPAITAHTRFTNLTAYNTLVSTGSTLTIDATFTDQNANNNITPGTPSVSGVGGATCGTLTGPTLVTADDDISGISDPVTYRWTCTASAGTTLPSSLTFSVGATGDGPTTYATGTSNSVLVAPQLSFQVSVNTIPGVTQVDNYATLDDSGAFITAQNSNTVTTTLTFTPTIIVTGSLSSFITSEGNGSTPQTYTVAGYYLTDDISITPPAGFEVSLDGSTWSTSLTLTQSGGSVATTTIYVRLFSNTGGTYSGDIAHTSTGAATQNLAVTGTVTAYRAVTIYYVTFPEDDVYTTFNVIEPGDGISPFHNRVTISIPVAGTLVFYDQWEDGSYDADIANPGTNTYNSSTNPDGTQIWGNGLAADGCAPRRISGSNNITTCSDANDVFLAGDIIMIEDDNIIVNPNTSATIDWDARDKIGASSTVAVSHLYWPSGAGVAMSTAHEMYPTSEWGTNYEAPVGEGTANTVNGNDYSQTFQHCAISAMASVANTTIQYDLEGNGTYEGSVVKGEGEAILIANTVQGTRVRSTEAGKPIQVLLVCGDIDLVNAGGYTVRDYTLLPTDKWGSSLWSPVGRSTATGTLTDPVSTRLFIYNPSFNSSIYVTCEKYNSTTPSQPIFTTPVQVLPRGVMNTDLVDWQGGRCFASDASGNETSEKIFGIGVFDPTLNTNYDWGFTLYSSDYLTSDLLVGMGFGVDPTGSSTNNAMPIWATAACSSGSTYLYVDWNNDGISDLIDMNGDGDTADTVNGIAESGSNNGIEIDRMQVVTLFEPGLDSEIYDQTGARVWTRTASGVGYDGEPGCPLTAAWGQDTLSAGSTVGGMIDAGTSIAPLRLIQSGKTSALITDSEPTGWSENDIARYVISVHPLGGTTVSNVRVYDTVPAGTLYEAGTTQYCLGPTAADCIDDSDWITIPDNTSGSAFPLDATGGVLIDDGVITGSETWYVRFNVKVFGDTDTVTNCSTIYSNAGRTIACVRNFVSSNTDWGDLPDIYGTISSSFGPRHTGNGLMLGTTWDKETNGQPSTGATDDGTDEDGAVKYGTDEDWFYGNGGFTVTITDDSAANTGYGCLNAWMDYDSDGVLEQVVTNQLVHETTNTVPVSLPVDWMIDQTATSFYFRFRLVPALGSDPYTCTGVNVLSTGWVLGGEVEDYLVEIGQPTGVRVTFNGLDQSDGILLYWDMSQGGDILGFNVWRSTSIDGAQTQVNGDMILTKLPPGSGGETSYDLLDSIVEPGVTYYYWLELVDIQSGQENQVEGPVQVLQSWYGFMPMIISGW